MASADDLVDFGLLVTDVHQARGVGRCHDDIDVGHHIHATAQATGKTNVFHQRQARQVLYQNLSPRQRHAKQPAVLVSLPGFEILPEGIESAHVER